MGKEMRFQDIPKAAWDAEPTPIPTKTVITTDWDALHRIIEMQGFVIIESKEIRVTLTGVEECIPVKSFNSYMRGVKKIKLFTYRLSNTRWVCKT